MADTAIAILGLRLDVDDDDIESLETRSNSAIAIARKAGLDCYWGNFQLPGEMCYLFVGKLLGKLGAEDSSEIQISVDQLAQMAADVATRLESAGFSATPTLFLQFQPDS